MSNPIKLKRNKGKIDESEIAIERTQLIKPLDPNHLPSILKVNMFLELLSKTEDSYIWLESQKNNDDQFEVDEDGIIKPDPKKYEEYKLKIKPIRDCEEFINRHGFNYWDLIALIETAGKSAVSIAAQEKAYKRLANDPKQKALAEIEQQYQAQKSKFKLRGFSAQFIRKMWAQYPVIESQKTIENLVAALNKENDSIPR